MGVMASLFLSCRLAKSALGLQLLLPQTTTWNKTGCSHRE